MVTVTTDGSGSWGYVLADMWQIGEFDGNLMAMHTSSGMLENIIGDCNTGGNVLSNFAVLFSFGTIEQKEKRALHVYVGM